MSNIDKFDILVGKVLAKLYAQFPVKSNIYINDFGYKINLEIDEMSGLKSSDDEIFFNATIEWLIENGIIQANRTSSGLFINAILTFKGLKLLKSVPKSVDDKTLGDYLKIYAQNSTNEGIKSVVNKIISLGLQNLF